LRVGDGRGEHLPQMPHARSATDYGLLDEFLANESSSTPNNSWTVEVLKKYFIE